MRPVSRVATYERHIKLMRLIVIFCRDGRLRIGDEIIKVNGVELLGQLREQSGASINHALTFDVNGFIEIQVRVDHQTRRRFRSSCSALDGTTTAQVLRDSSSSSSSKGFALGSAPSDLDYVPVYAGNCKMLANQMSDDEKWQNLSKKRQGLDSPVSDYAIPKPMSLMTLSQPSPPLDDVALKERVSNYNNIPGEGERASVY